MILNNKIISSHINYQQEYSNSNQHHFVNISHRITNSIKINVYYCKIDLNQLIN